MPIKKLPDLFKSSHALNILRDFYLTDNNKIIISKLAKDINSTFSNTSFLINRLKRLNLLTAQKSGRIVMVKATPLGLNIGSKIQEICILLKD